MRIHLQWILLCYCSFHANSVRVALCNSIYLGIYQGVFTFFQDAAENSFHPECDSVLKCSLHNCIFARCGRGSRRPKSIWCTKQHATHRAMHLRFCTMFPSAIVAKTILPSSLFNIAIACGTMFNCTALTHTQTQSGIAVVASSISFARDLF